MDGLLAPFGVKLFPTASPGAGVLAWPLAPRFTRGRWGHGGCHEARRLKSAYGRRGLFRDGENDSLGFRWRSEGENKKGHFQAGWFALKWCIVVCGKGLLTIINGTALPTRVAVVVMKRHRQGEGGV